MINKFIPVLFAVLFLAIGASAQTKRQTESEITELRRQTIAAIEKRDRRTLEAIYADDFSHTHASGKVDNRKTRLDTYVAGDKTIDTAPAEDVKIKIFGEATAVATGKSSVKNDAGEAVVYRWTIVYAKISKKWRIAASQATVLTE